MENNTEILKKTWDNIANKHAKYHKLADLEMDDIPHKWLKEFKDKKILEIGVGDGVFLFPVAKNNNFCVGIDISQGMLNLCMERYKTSSNFEMSFVRCDARNLPFLDDVFDLVYSLGVVEHFVETQKAIKEHERVCKINGEVFLSVPHKLSLHYILKIISQYLGVYDIGYEKSFTLNEFKSMVELTNLNIIESKILPINYKTTTSRIRYLSALLVLCVDYFLSALHMGGHMIFLKTIK